MLIAYAVAIELIHDLRDLVPVIKRHDADLADQIHRAATSVVLTSVRVSASPPATSAATSSSRTAARTRSRAASSSPRPGAGSPIPARRAARSTGCWPCSGA